MQFPSSLPPGPFATVIVGEETRVRRAYRDYYPAAVVNEVVGYPVAALSTEATKPRSP